MNWYNNLKKASLFSTDPFGSGELTDKVRTSPYGFAGGDTNSGILSPSDKNHHANDYFSEGDHTPTIEKRLDEQKKKKRIVFKKIKNNKQKTAAISQADVLSYTSEAIRGLSNSLQSIANEVGANSKHDVVNLCHKLTCLAGTMDRFNFSSIGEIPEQDVNLLTIKQTGLRIIPQALQTITEIQKFLPTKETNQNSLRNIFDFLIYRPTHVGKSKSEIKTAQYKDLGEYTALDVYELGRMIEDQSRYAGENTRHYNLNTITAINLFVQKMYQLGFEDLKSITPNEKELRSFGESLIISAHKSIEELNNRHKKNINHDDIKYAPEAHTKNNNNIKKAQFGTNGPNIPMFNTPPEGSKNGFDWITNTYNEITRNEKNGNDIYQSLDTISESTITVQAYGKKYNEIGSGFFFSNKLVITCSHVVHPDGDAKAEKIIIKHKDKSLEALIYIEDRNLDIAILVLKDKNYFVENFLHFANSKEVNMGDQIIVFGTPLGFENVAEQGMVSSQPIDYQDGNIKKNYIIVSANMSPGNSGGPVVKQDDNKIIGVAAVTLESEENVGRGLSGAIPIDAVKSFLKKNGIRYEQ
jgi:S1-C subfamily serine protease